MPSAHVAAPMLAYRNCQHAARRDDGPGMIRYGRVDLICSPAAAGFVGWRIDRLERSIKPTEAQRGKFDELKAASNKASEAMRVAFPMLRRQHRDGWRRWKNDWMRCCRPSRPYGPRSRHSSRSATSKRRASMLLPAGCASGENFGRAALV